MSIKNYVDELENIQAEIKRNNLANRNLRQRVKELEFNIREYLIEKGQHGLKYKDKAIIIENKETRKTKGKKEKETSIISLLEELGVSHANEAYNKLLDVSKNEPIEESQIKFKKLNKF